MARAFLLVMDSVGIGGASDEAAFGDAGADTLGHIAGACAAGRADVPGGRSGPLAIPVMNRLGIGRAAEASTGSHPAGIERIERPEAIWGFAREVSKGKDTQSGHWELAGLPVPFTWGYFPDTIPAFPEALTAALIAEAGLPGILGNRHASGTAVIAELGAEHVRTGKPICYTSADSVFQIAAHEEAFGLERLYEVCRIARRLCDPLRIGRVIARPFLGDAQSGFERTGHRRDFAVPPPEPTLLDDAVAAGRTVFGVGKIGDIFSGRGVSRVLKAPENASQFEATLEAAAEAKDGDLVVTNFIDFDQIYGHRRDVAGYAACLEDFDARLPRLLRVLRPGDLVVLTADHGNDPTFRGSDHTRENIPVLAFGPGIEGRPAGERRTYADVAQTIAAHLALPRIRCGTSLM
ncbi:phosphopentomutase [Propylenella binzhouense]|uniref:Phosphopentomutase n=1 Tax=Propylenella binzhouense TaxID=2555902 RepID=A0A964T788_9HYPH|nr:phosphopentomutase [Propylenella binzhouense]MYZ48687.1 phosphopentomutase [Propylenella binzhouense]